METRTIRKRVDFDIRLYLTRIQEVGLEKHREYYSRYYNMLYCDYSSGRKLHSTSSCSSDLRDVHYLREKYPKMKEVNTGVFSSAIRDYHSDCVVGSPKLKSYCECVRFITTDATFDSNGLSIPTIEGAINARFVLSGRGSRGHIAQGLLDKGVEFKLRKASITKHGYKYRANLECDVEYEETYDENEYLQFV